MESGKPNTPFKIPRYVKILGIAALVFAGASLLIAMYYRWDRDRIERQTAEYWDRQYNLLGDLVDNKGRLIKRAESGWQPGEDIWLKITRYDTLGNVIEDYGAATYGHKYKETFKYDQQNRVIEVCGYSYSSKNNEYGYFENYGDHDYELKDTLVGFIVTDKQVQYRLTFMLDSQNKMVRHRSYTIELDSVTNEPMQLLSLDTLYCFDSPFQFGHYEITVEGKLERN